MPDLAALLFIPFLAACLFVGIHSWLGLQVLRRKVVFADLALAQLSALGGTIAVAVGHAPGDPASFGYAFALTLFGAGLLTATRNVSARVGQEAIIGILYVVATAASILVVDRSPQGAEHVKRMLVGDILTVSAADLLKLALAYGTVGIVHALCRHRFLATDDGRAPPRPKSSLLWDFLFYATFGLVVTSSVAVAGVLLVFSFLIIPAVIGSLFTSRIGMAFGVGWGAGIAASALGFATSVALDAPTGATMVVSFATALLVAAGVRALFVAAPAARGRHRRRATFVAATTLLVAAGVQGVWLMAQPAGDQPLLALVEEGLGTGPELFLSEAERRVFREAAEMERGHRAEVERLAGKEREARWRGEALREDELRRMSSFQQTFNEMGRGERFVQDHLRILARVRERWIVGIPLAVLSGAGLFLLFQFRKRTQADRTGQGNAYYFGLSIRDRPGPTRAGKHTGK